jgi:hypothetical protein
MNAATVPGCDTNEARSGNLAGMRSHPAGHESLRRRRNHAGPSWQCCPVDVSQQIAELFEQGAAHERDHELVPARRLLGAALAAAYTAGLSEIVQASHQLLGVVEHEQGRLDEARRHLELGLRLALDAHEVQYTPQCPSATSDLVVVVSEACGA